MSALVVASNHLEACRAWQEIIAAQSTVQAKDAAGSEAVHALKDQTHLGTRKLIVAGDVSMFFPDGIDRSEEETRPVIQFGETKAQGWLGRPGYKRIGQQAFIDWVLYNPHVLGPAEDVLHNTDAQSLLEDELQYRLPLDQQLRRPLHFPVGLINYALCYDR